MRSVWAASRGAISLRIALMASLVSALARLKNVAATRFSSWPDRSRATMVFSNVGGPDAPAIASISAIWSAMPRSNAGW